MANAEVESFCHRIERHLVRQGGFALIAGEPGTGKSVTLCLLANRLSRTDGLIVAAITHPSSRLSDFYREMGELFGVDLLYNNRWACFKQLRERWLAHLDDIRMRPVLLIDEAQEPLPSVFAELRLLASIDFDSRAILSVVFAGNNRLLDRLRRPDLQALASRIHQRLGMMPAKPEELEKLLDNLLDQAGNRGLVTHGLMDTRPEEYHDALRERAAREDIPESLLPGYRKGAALGGTLLEADGLDAARRAPVAEWAEAHETQAMLAEAVRALPDRVRYAQSADSDLLRDRRRRILVAGPTDILYLGKAGARTSDLRKRVRHLPRFGVGRASNHKGGEWLWQLEGIDDTERRMWCCPRGRAEPLERERLAQFRSNHGEWPIANRY